MLLDFFRVGGEHRVSRDTLTHRLHRTRRIDGHGGLHWSGILPRKLPVFDHLQRELSVLDQRQPKRAGMLEAGIDVSRWFLARWVH
jgi:hypothetical protein